MATKKKTQRAKKAQKKTAKKRAQKPKQIPNADGVPVFCEYTKIIPIQDAHPNPRNRNQHPQIQIDLLAKIIKAQGWRNPIVISTRSNLITKGHGRLMAAKALGVTEIPVDYQEYADQATEWADMIADNRIPELAQMDVTGLKDDLLDMDAMNMDMDLTGFDTEALQAFITDVPEVQEPDPPAPSGTPVTCPECGHTFQMGSAGAAE